MPAMFQPGTPAGGQEPPAPAKDAAARLAEAAARSPELAAILARRAPGQGRATVRFALFGLGLGAAAILVAFLAARRPHRTAEADEPEALPREQVLAPLTATLDPATGVQVAPFSGFAVSVDTVPPGAVVTIAGVTRGEAPVMVGLECDPGAPIEVRAEKAGAGRARAQVPCRADSLVKVALRLHR